MLEAEILTLKKNSNMPEYEVLYFVRVMKTKKVKAKTPELAASKFIDNYKGDRDNLSIDYELRDNLTGDMINMYGFKSVENYI